MLTPEEELPPTMLTKPPTAFGFGVGLAVTDVTGATSANCERLVTLCADRVGDGIVAWNQIGDPCATLKVQDIKVVNIP